MNNKAILSTLLGAIEDNLHKINFLYTASLFTILSVCDRAGQLAGFKQQESLA